MIVKFVKTSTVEWWWWLCLTTSVWGTNCAIHNRLRGQAIMPGLRMRAHMVALGGATVAQEKTNPLWPFIPFLLLLPCHRNHKSSSQSETFRRPTTTTHCSITRKKGSGKSSTLRKVLPREKVYPGGSLPRKKSTIHVRSL